MPESSTPTVTFSEAEWEEIQEEAARQGAERGRDVKPEDIVRIAVREFLYRSRRRS